MTHDRPLRADAARNRELVLRVAAELFAEHGLDVSLDEIARTAGLGVGTVYRRFPNRAAVVEALFQDRIEQMACLARECLTDDDPWRGLVTFLRRGVAQAAADKGLRRVILADVHGGIHLAARAALDRTVAELVERCHAAGALRPGVSATDIPMIFLMVGAVGDFAGRQAPAIWERYLELLIAGIRPGVHPSPRIPALSEAEVRAATSSRGAGHPGRRQ